MRRKISLNVFDPNSIKSAASKLSQMAKDFKKIDEKILEEVCSYGAESCRENIILYGAIDEADLYNSVGYEVKDNIGYIYANSDHAKYVEYGTGVVGQRADYDGSLPFFWVYDYNSHGDDGWVYRDKHNEYHWTKGQASRPFMYDTAKDLKTDGASKAVKKVIEHELQK